MNELKNSNFLDKIIAKMSNYNSTSSKKDTAEKFLIAVIDCFFETKEDDLESNSMDELKEIEKTIEILLSLNFDVGLFRDYLEKNIETENYMSVVYFQMRVADVRNCAEKENIPVIRVDALLESILKNPSDNISKLISEASENNNQKPLDILDIGEIESTEQHFDASPDKSDDKSDIVHTEARNKKNLPSSKNKLIAITKQTNEIRKFLSENIYGQDKAINIFSSGYFQSELSSLTDSGRKHPKATFLFAGPPGVGKTFMAEKAAEILKLPFMRFDMSEYCDKESSVEFIGSDNVYKNSKGGNFTTFVAENPKSLVLFDEIEKAHISIIHLFLQILDAGRIRDSQSDREISLVDTIMIFTTNAGKQLYENNKTEDLSAFSRKIILNALQEDKNPSTGAPYFPAAICSRFASGNVVMFNHIKANNLREIAKNEVLRQAENFSERTDIIVTVEDNVFTSLLFAEGGFADARTIRSRAESFFNSEIYELLRLINIPDNNADIENLETINIGVSLPENDPEITSLFNLNRKTNAFVFSENMAETCILNCPSVNFKGVQTIDEAVKSIKSEDIDFVLLDLSVGIKENIKYLNFEDVDSLSKEMLSILFESFGNMPVYILQTSDFQLSDEEKTSFLGKGVRGFVHPCADNFSSEITKISEATHQQESIDKLAKSNKVVTFETLQKTNTNGKNAEIQLFGFKLSTAVDANDQGSVLISKPTVRFDQVIGSEDAKNELQYFIKYLKDPKSFIAKGVNPPKGIILYGPPGTGKTMLAKATACESDVTFIAAEGNQFLKKYVGEGSEKVHELFKTARKYAPSILFIDEIDAIAKERNGGENSSDAEATLTAFLSEMDGFKNDVSKPVFVLAATNFDVKAGTRKSLDQALMRRFDRRIFVDLPKKDERLKYIKMKVSSNSAYNLSDEKINNIVTRSTGMSIAQLESVFELALRTVIRFDKTTVTGEILDEAFETFNGGEQKKWDNSQLERVANHETGHALLCLLSGETPSYLTIVARGDHGGYMQHSDNEGKALYTRDELLKKIQISLGGRAAEIVCYGAENGLSTGASGDLENATGIARQMVCAYGMDSELGLATITQDDLKNDTVSKSVREHINKILNAQMQEAINNINNNKVLFDALVRELLSKNHLTEAEIEAVYKSLKE